MTKKQWIGIIVASIIIVPILFNNIAKFVAGKMSAQNANKPAPVEIAKTQSEVVYPQIESVGRVEAKYSVDVVARINGWLQTRYFQEGAFVKKGQTLFLIQPNEYAIAVEQAKASVRQASAALVNSEKELKRASELVKNDFVSKSYYDQALATRDQNKANLDAAKAALASAQLNLSYTKVTSPVDGKVGKILITEGNLVNPQSGPLTKIVSVSPIYTIFTIKSEDYLKFVKAQKEAGRKDLEDAEVKITLSDGSEYKENGALEFVNNEVDQTSGTITLRATFQNKEHLLVPGDFVNVVAKSKQPVSVVTVPQVAVSDSTQGTYVWVVGNENKVEQKFVTIDKQTGDNWIVTEGLEPDMTVVTAGFGKLRPNAVVAPIEKKEAPVQSETPKK